MGGRDEEQMLQEFAQSLPDTERSLFAFHLTDRSYQEIADITGLSELALRVKTSRLKNLFKQRYL
jgi:DNA-directed RNA polymerase specialized sigma24 family protein